MRSRKYFCALLACFMMSQFLPADSFSFSSKTMSSITAKGKERTVLSGGAKIKSDSTEITAETITLTGKDWQYAQCDGNVVVVDEKKGIVLSAPNVLFDRVTKKSRVQGQCSMEDRKNKVIIKGGYLENDEESETTLIQIGVRIMKEDMICRSEFALYDRKTKNLDLSGMPVVYWKGDEYRASRITVNLDTEDIRLHGDVRGSIKQKDEAGEKVQP